MSLTLTLRRQATKPKPRQLPVQWDSVSRQQDWQWQRKTPDFLHMAICIHTYRYMREYTYNTILTHQKWHVFILLITLVTHLKVCSQMPAVYSDYDVLIWFASYHYELTFPDCCNYFFLKLILKGNFISFYFYWYLGNIFKFQCVEISMLWSHLINFTLTEIFSLLS